MFQQFISLIQDDPNPRLHRLPFFILWIMSFAMGWYILFLYEQGFFFGILGRSFCDFLRYQYIREGLFVGLIFGITLSITQTWLIRQRYGYVPKYWLILTILGSIIAGLGYPRIANPMSGGYFENELVNYCYWFLVLGIFQTLSLWSTNRKAWLMILANLLAGLIFLIFSELHYQAHTTLLSATIIQSFGTGLAILYIMEHPRKGIVPKRDSSTLPTKFSLVSFVLLWFVIYCFSTIVILSLHEVWRSLGFHQPIIRNIIGQFPNTKWYIHIINFSMIGLGVSIAQHWLIQKYTNREIKGWVLCTSIGWIIAGFIWWLFEYRGYFRDSRRVLLICYSIAPILIQAIPLSRALHKGRLWASASIIISLLLLLMFQKEYLTYSDIFLMPNIFISFTTALMFYFIHISVSHDQGMVKSP